MNYILIGVLIAIVWKLVEFVYEIACELFLSILHESKWYQISAGKQSMKNSKDDSIKSVKNPIGFYHGEEES